MLAAPMMDRQPGLVFIVCFLWSGWDKIDWNIIRISTGAPANWTVDVYTPTGLPAPAQSELLSATSVRHKITVTAAAEGAGCGHLHGNDGNDVVCPNLNVYDAVQTQYQGGFGLKTLYVQIIQQELNLILLLFPCPAGWIFLRHYYWMVKLYNCFRHWVFITAPGSCVSRLPKCVLLGPNPLLGHNVPIAVGMSIWL